MREDVNALFDRRLAAVKRIKAALAHHTIGHQLYIITSWMSIEELEKLADTQEGK